jgi:hypothetical protein
MPLLLPPLEYASFVDVDVAIRIICSICSIARTPIAKFCGSFQSFKATELGSIAIKGAIEKLPPNDL